jgi:prophage regulatory protein
VSEWTAVYRLYDSGRVLLYVGVTKDFRQRRQRHKATKPWWPQVKHPTIEMYDDEQDALQAERDAIKREHPVHNVARDNRNYRSRRAGSTARYFMGTGEIRRMLGGISQQRAHQIVNHKDFPQPYAVLDMGKVWKRADVEVWAREHGRVIHGDDASAD